MNIAEKIQKRLKDEFNIAVESKIHRVRVNSIFAADFMMRRTDDIGEVNFLGTPTYNVKAKNWRMGRRSFIIID